MEVQDESVIWRLRGCQDAAAPWGADELGAQFGLARLLSVLSLAAGVHFRGGHSRSLNRADALEVASCAHGCIGHLLMRDCGLTVLLLHV